MANTKVNELSETQGLALTDQLLALTDSENNTVQLSSVETLLNSVVSDDNTNSLQFLDGKLYVNEKGLKPVNVLASSGSVTLESNTINRVNVTGTLELNLPNPTLNVFNQILVQLSMSTLQSVSLGTTYTFNDVLPTLTESGDYDLIYEHDGTNWYVGIIKRSNAAL